ncbi:hypothetical protein HanPI659440_Chr13g0509141 [Helianthus annuus]|nr:hypothetical protein HanPI659440_Chr13g0509141 [Helianthus annuus]
MKMLWFVAFVKCLFEFVVMVYYFDYDDDDDGFAFYAWAFYGVDVMCFLWWCYCLFAYVFAWVGLLSWSYCLCNFVFGCGFCGGGGGMATTSSGRPSWLTKMMIHSFEILECFVSTLAMMLFSHLAWQPRLQPWLKSKPQLVHIGYDAVLSLGTTTSVAIMPEI